MRTITILSCSASHWCIRSPTSHISAWCRSMTGLALLAVVVEPGRRHRRFDLLDRLLALGDPRFELGDPRGVWRPLPFASRRASASCASAFAVRLTWASAWSRRPLAATVSRRRSAASRAGRFRPPPASAGAPPVGLRPEPRPGSRRAASCSRGTPCRCPDRPARRRGRSR